MAKVGFVGLGKLGLPYAEYLSEHHDVLGFDVSDVQSSRISLVASLHVLARECETVFVCVPTPHESRYDGSSPIAECEARDFGYDQLRQVVSEIAQSSHSPTIIVISTVLPGTMRREIYPLLAGGTLIYMPAFAAMGEVYRGLSSPDVAVAGVAQMDGASEIHKTLKLLGVNAEVVTWEEAETIKILYNTFITLKITFANSVIDIANTVGNIDSDVVIRHLVRAKRVISDLYMKPGLGDGGPCHPRDNIAMRWFAERYKLGYDLSGYLTIAREHQARNLAKYAASFRGNVLVVGRFYKPGVPLTDGSYSLLVAHYLEVDGKLAGIVEPDDFLSAPFAETIILSYNDPTMAALPFRAGTTIIDPWRQFRFHNTRTDLHVVDYGLTRGVSVINDSVFIPAPSSL
ncbi:MAG: hypothetical protein J0I79_33060 [Mesorhizobium sp.]|uniref:hypothetical protein n=1 Tax=Mesorhizobium sp. TaxID=1871066 RepID=UPI001AD2F0F6|nr:hypothetical protein [Mesorhizobium sp.]MBN9222787.1 hypothetical protein [Mesorhizobium sp.]